MCRCRTSLIGGTKKGHGKISWPNPIEVLQQNPPDRRHEGRRSACPRRGQRRTHALQHSRRDADALMAKSRHAMKPFDAVAVAVNRVVSDCDASVIPIS